MIQVHRYHALFCFSSKDLNLKMVKQMVLIKR